MLMTEHQLVAFGSSFTKIFILSFFLNSTNLLLDREKNSQIKLATIRFLRNDMFMFNKHITFEGIKKGNQIFQQQMITGE